MSIPLLTFCHQLINSAEIHALKRKQADRKKTSLRVCKTQLDPEWIRILVHASLHCFRLFMNQKNPLHQTRQSGEQNTLWMIECKMK